uniref:PNPLA domain-containing protein n=1 Tax=viral metagenome TaxID=1070528 RepID=A0A6C0IXR4_9ZZZZ
MPGKKKIHFILPGGGVRGSFQAGFLHKLFTDYPDTFETYKIDGTSVGAINGVATILNRTDLLKDIWLSIKNINDFFSKWSTNPILGQLYNLYAGFYNNGLYSNDRLTELLEKNLSENLGNIDSDTLEKYSCVVTNIKDAKIEYINGKTEKLFQYVTASASPWIISNPIKINDILYTDGGLLETYPTNYILTSKADLIIIVGFDQEVVQYLEPTCSNILVYLASLIDITRFNSLNSLNIINYVKEGRCIPITNTMKCSFMNFTPEIIKDGFDHGVEAAEQFYKTYLEEVESSD